MGFTPSTNDTHPGSAEEIPERVEWANGPYAGRRLSEAPRMTPVQRFVIDQEAAEQARAARRWAELESVDRMQIRAKRLGLEKAELDVRIELEEMRKAYPAEFTLPGAGRPPWFYPTAIAICLLQLTLLLVLVAHTTHPTLSKEAALSAPEAPEPAPLQGRAAAQKGGR